MAILALKYGEMEYGDILRTKVTKELKNDV